MAIVKLHNPVLAENSKFGNLILEGLASDPAVTGVQNAGRIWFNTTEKKLKGTFLAANGTSLETKVIADAADIDALDARLDTVEAQTIGKIGDLTTLTTTAKSTLVAAINELDAEHGVLSTLTTTAKGTFVAAINELDADKVEKINITAGSVGSVTEIPTINYNAQGQITSVSTNSIQIDLQGVTTTGNTTDNAITLHKADNSAGLTADFVTSTGNVTVGGTLGVTGDTTLAGVTAGAVSATTVSTSGAATLNSATVSTNLGVTGNTTVGGTLGVTGTATFGDVDASTVDATGNVTVGGTLGVTGATTLASVGVTGAATVGGTLGVTGATTLASVGVTGAATVGGTLGVTGVATFTDVDASTVDATGNVTVGGTLGVTGATTLASVGVTGAATVDGTTDLKGATTVGTVGTNADLTVNGNVVTTGNSTVDGDFVVNGNLTVSGTQTVIETEILKVADNIITLNNGIGAVAPTQSAGLEVDRGTEGVMTFIQWNETTDVVEVWQGTQLLEVATKANITSASNNLQNELDATQTSAGINADGSFTAFTGTYTTDTNLKAGVVTLDTNLARVETGVGVWGDLTTTSKVVVGAINELDAELGNTALSTGATTISAAINEVDTHANSLYAVLGVTTDATVSGFAGLNYVADDATVKAAVTTLDTQLKDTTDQVDGKIGNPADLTTTANSTLVAAINEVDLHANSIYGVMGVTVDATLTGFNGLHYVIDDSSLKVAISALDAQLYTTTTQVDGNIGDLGTLTTTSNGTLVDAINEVDTHTNSLYTVLGVTTDASTTGITGLTYVADGSTIVAAITALDTQLETTTNQVDGKIGDLADLTTADKTTIVAAINSEVSRATGVEGSLASLTTTANTSLVAAINELDTGLTDENSRAVGAETLLTNNLNSEITNRTNADTALGVRIDNVNTAAGITGDAYVANGSANYIATATSLNDADVKLDTSLKTVVTDYASTADSKGSSLVGYKGYTETDINIVNPAIEITAGSVEAALTDIAASVNLRIHEIENRYVKGEVSAQDASDTYTIAHNLDTNFVDVSVQVYDTDLTVWRFDLVVVEVIDVNTVKISLASGVSSQIRYVIHGY